MLSWLRAPTIFSLWRKQGTCFPQDSNRAELRLNSNRCLMATGLSSYCTRSTRTKVLAVTKQHLQTAGSPTRQKTCDNAVSRCIMAEKHLRHPLDLLRPELAYLDPTTASLSTARAT
nr:hypothetical protein CFP56_07564 [Quercus suber]